MNETPKNATPECELEVGLKRFFEEHRAYHRAWADEWDKKVEANCPLTADYDHADDSFPTFEPTRNSEEINLT